MEALPLSFFCPPAEVVAPELIGCLLVKRQADASLLWGVVVETEAYSQDEPACHGYRRRSPQNEMLFGEPGRFYVYVSYGIHHCMKRAVMSRSSGCVCCLRELAFATALLISSRLNNSITGNDDAQNANKQYFLFSNGEDLLSSPRGRVDEEVQEE